MKTSYRIIDNPDAICGSYIVQAKYWWCPIWIKAGFHAQHETIAEAELYVSRKQDPIKREYHTAPTTQEEQNEKGA